MLLVRSIPILYSIAFLPPSIGASKSWISLNLSVPQWINDETDQMLYNYGYVDVLVGTPPQKISLSIDTQTDITAVYSDRCLFCPGTRSFDESVSSTFDEDTNLPFNSTAAASGSWARDTISLGGVLENTASDFVLFDWASSNVTARGRWPINGQLALIQEDLRSFNHTHLFADLYRSGKLIDPVVGMRLDPVKPRLTVGAVDPNDYEGTLNWVKIEPHNENYTQYHVFEFDGILGRNGSHTNPDNRMLAAIDSKSINIAVHETWTGLSSRNFIGPVYHDLLFADPQDSGPSIHMSIIINGVSYEVNSKDLLRNQTDPPKRYNPGITTTYTLFPQEPRTILGLPFLRSVYMAYRFPTDSCPGYFGFAFPSGANRSQEQIVQKPTSTPTLSSQCLIFATPTSVPSPLAPLPVRVGKQYPVFREDSRQVELIGAEQLVKGVWNVTSG